MLSPAAARDHSLDALRAAMMLLGLVLHSGASYTATPLGWAWPYQDAQTNGGFDALLAVIHLFRMPVFFVIAGFFAALLYDRDGAAAFIRNRARRVLLPLALFWALVIPLVGLGFIFALWRTGANLALEAPLGGSILRQPILGHLWFLYDLVLYYAAAVIVVPLASRLPGRVRERAQAAFRAVATKPWGIAVLAALTMFPIIPMNQPGIGLSASLLPRPDVLAAYGLFFTFGWLLHGHRNALQLYGGRWTRTAPAALGCSAAYVFVVAARPVQEPMWLLVAVALCALSVWLLIFAITGLFVRHLDAPRPVVRYFSDAAYWTYLVHLPLTIWIPGLLARSPLPAAVKFAIVFGITTLVTTITYDYLVRPTRIGGLLNGRRYPRGLPKAVPDPRQAIV